MAWTTYETRRRRYRDIQDAFVQRRSSSAPLVIELEPTTKCNIACVFCPRDSMKRAGGSLSEGRFLTILENLGEAAGNGMLLFSGFGEPMKHEEMEVFVRHAKDAGWFCGITTNGTLLSVVAVERLLSAGLDVLQVSLHARKGLTYSRVVRGTSYEDVVRKVEAIVPLCEGRIVFSLNFTVTPWNRQETRDFASYWKGRGVSHMNFSRCHNRGGHFQGFEQGSGPPSSRERAEGCWSFHNAHYITWEGQLLACCNDLTGETNRGDLCRLALREILDLEGRREPFFAVCEHCDFPFR
jgi:MoaA/NifB/PqqE/SkfB family radical SAM enzyme